MNKCFEGLKVIDLTSALNGPFCTMFLADYGAEVINEPGIALNGITLGDGEYFVLGDNRNHSSDSRTTAVGPIKREKIIGKAWVRIYPFDRITKVD